MRIITHILIVLAVFILAFPSFGQSKVLVLGDTSTKVSASDINEHFLVLLDSTRRYSIGNLPKAKLRKLNKSRKIKPSDRLWIKFSVEAKKSGWYYLYVGKAEQIKLYKEGSSTAMLLGEFTPRSSLDVPQITKSARVFLEKDRISTFYASLENETMFAPRLGFSASTSAHFWDTFMLRRVVWQAVFHGAILMMIVFNLILFVSIEDKSYLYYVLYMLSLAVTFFLHDQLHYISLTSLAEYPKIMYFIELATGQLSLVAFVFFVRSLIRTDKLVPTWDKIILYWAILRLVSTPVVIYLDTYLFEGNTFQNFAYLLDFIMLIIICIVLLLTKDKVAQYLVMGTLPLGLLGLATVLGWYGILNINVVEHWLQIGIALQLVLFSAALGYKSRRNAGLVFELQQENERLVSNLQSKVNEQEKTLRVFMKYVPEPVVSKALNQADGTHTFEGEQRYVTCLFCDIRGFTTLSEEMNPREVVAFLNDFYSEMTQVVKKFGGSVNQFIGDEIFAVFGAPLNTTDNEKRATLAALDMKEKMVFLNEKYEPQFKRYLKVGIGINAGQVVAGNFGSEEKIEYSLTGDTVNTAKRIEALTKSDPDTILVSESVYQRVSQFVRVKPLPSVDLRGKKDKLQIYKILGKI